jgi:uncharacterized membrane protein YedE/YeeE
MTKDASRTLVALASGTLFGFGLSLSGMLDPVRVRGFLDIFGDWDASLVFVLGGAVVVATIGVIVQRRRPHPTFDTAYTLPTARAIDRRLLIGSAMFGIGWGIAGFCPGPALASLVLGLPATMLFVVAMITGMLIHERYVRT